MVCSLLSIASVLAQRPFSPVNQPQARKNAFLRSARPSCLHCAGLLTRYTVRCHLASILCAAFITFSPSLSLSPRPQDLAPEARPLPRHRAVDPLSPVHRTALRERPQSRQRFTGAADKLQRRESGLEKVGMNRSVFGCALFVS